MLKKIIVTLLFIVCNALLFAASVSKAPDWVIQFPVDNEYYVGVATDSDMEGAKNKAISTILFQIEANVKSDIEQSKTIKAINNSVNTEETIDSLINMKSKETLEDLELMGTWFDQKKEQYHVYYRLHIKTMQEKLEKRKEDAKQIAYDYYKKAFETEVISTRVKFLFYAYSTIVKYIDEELIVNYNGSKVNIVTAVVSSLEEYLNEIYFAFDGNEILTRFSQDNRLNFMCFYKNQPLSGMPFNVSSEHLTFKDMLRFTSNDGVGTVVVESIESSRENVSLLATLNYDEILKDVNTESYVEKAMLLFINLPRTELVCAVKTPTFSVDVTVSDDIASSQYAIDDVITDFKKKVQERLRVNFNKSDYDYKVIFKIHNRFRESKFHFSFLNIVFSIVDKSGKEIFSYNFPEIKGGNNSPERALDTSIKKFKSEYVDEAVEKMISYIIK